MLGLGTGGFGKLEDRLSHFGALNTFYNNTDLLFDEETQAKIREVPFTRTITIPIFTKDDATIITIRTCEINGKALGVTQKTIVRFHVAVDVSITPSEYRNNMVSYEAALRRLIQNAKNTIYKYLDTMCAAYLDTNKDVTIPIGAKTLYTGALGEIQVPKTLDFYNNLAAIMAEMDINGPFFTIGNTAALADQNWLRNPGGGATFDTAAIMRSTQIEEMEYTNRISPGSGQRGIQYVAPRGSIAILNFIDPDYQDAPDLLTLDATEEKDISDVRYWGKMNDPIFPKWMWGVMQLLDCAAEAKVYRAKQSADFALVSDFSSTVGESPIKRFSIMG